MRRTFSFSALALAAALISPVLVTSTAHAQAPDHRYYDSHNKDYHTWSPDEDKAYHSYLSENHRKYKDFQHLSKKQQQAYWAWRHNHMS
jgi:hypothetical protein